MTLSYILTLLLDVMVCFIVLSNHFLAYSILPLQPCYLNNWELHVHFKVHGQPGALFGDGLAVWYAKERLELG